MGGGGGAINISTNYRAMAGGDERSESRKGLYVVFKYLRGLFINMLVLSVACL